MTRTILLFAVGALLVVPGRAQQPAGQGTVAFRTTTRLVVQSVVVKDKEGRPIEGLTARDFTVTEDGEPQEVRFAEFQRLPAPVELPVPSPDLGPSSPPPAPSTGSSRLRPPTEVSIAPSGTGEIRYANRRLLVFYFDLTSLGPEDLLRTYNAARKFVSTQMTPADLVAVLSFQGGGVRVAQDFSDNREQLLGVLEALAFGGAFDGNGLTNVLEDGAGFGQGDGEFQILNTNRQLSALQNAVEMLRPLAEQKSLIYFASGLQLNGADNQAQLRATANASLRANVSIYPIDARGLVAAPPLGDATRASPGALSMFSGQAAGAVVNAAQRTQDTLFSLAKDTGGKAMFDYNDLSLGIVEAARSTTSYYIVGFYSSHTALDGKFHRLKVAASHPLATDVTYRAGYYADREYARFTDADKERQLADALQYEDPVTDLTIAMEVNYFQLNRAEYFVPVAVKIPGSELVLARRGGAARTTIDFIGEIKDESNQTIQNVRDKVEIKVSDQTAAELARRPVQYATGFTLLPGNYALKVLARNADTGHIGTFLTTFAIPNLERETARLPISSVVLSSQRIPLTEALYNVQTKDAQAVDPLVVDGYALIPSVTRVFSKTRNLYVFLQAYERGATTIDPLVGFVSFYQGATKVTETPVLVVTDGLDPRTKAVPLRFAIPLDSLTAGRYDLQVTVARPATQKVAFWRAAIVVVD